MEHSTKHERTLATIEEVVHRSRSLGIAHQIIEDEALDGRSITINGEKVVNFGSCSYMGLEVDERLKKGAIEAVMKYGTQFSSSRAYLSVTLYKEIEELLSAIFEAPVILAPTTTLCHQSNLPVLIGDNDAILLDYQVHESVQNAVRILKARNIHVEIVRHNNMEALEEKIQTLSKTHGKVWYMADGVYSMLGDLAPMHQLTHLLSTYEQFHLYIDDAHGLSWAGKNGAGYVKDKLWSHERMFMVGSLAKSFGACGGVTVFPNEKYKNQVKSCGPTLTFSGPIQPPVLGAAIESAKIHLSDEIYVRQQQFMERMTFFNKRSAELGVPLIHKSLSPIFFIGVGKPDAGYDIAKKIMEHGYYANVSVFPSVSITQSGLRIPVTLHHTLADIDGLLSVLAKELPDIFDRYDIDQQMIQRVFKLKQKAEKKIEYGKPVNL